MRDSQTKLDQLFWNFISKKDDVAVFDFCSGLVQQYPVCMDLNHCIEDMVDYLENSMILFSGYKSEKYEILAKTAKQMIRQEVESGKWNNMPDDEKEAGEIIAQRALDDITETDSAIENPHSVYMVIGLYAYTTVISSRDISLWHYIRLFVYSWLIYYSDKLSMSAISSQLSGNIKS